jgi:putative ABC transport system permease protein
MNPQPPRLADRLLEWFCAPHLLEEVQGDLYERFTRDVQLFGLSKAKQRYWLNVLRFIRPFALKRRSELYSSPGLLSFTMLRNYLKTSLRNLTKHKVSTLINLFGLTLGITACLVIYLITNYELSYDTFHSDSGRIYRLVGETQYGASSEKHPVGFVPNAVPKAIREEISGLETVAAFHNISSDVLIPNGKEKPKRFEGSRHDELVVVEPQYFDMFRYEWLAGNPKTALREPFKVVLSEPKARTYFGNIPLDAMLGKEVIYDDSVRVSVAGIVKEWAQPSDFNFTDFISFATIRASKLKQSINLDQWTDIWSASQAFVKLPPGATPEQFTAQFQRFGKTHFTKDMELQFTPALQPLSDLHFNDDYDDNYSRKAHLPTLYGLMAIAAFILLIAAINFINLATAQSAQRAKETGIRKVMGSSRANLIFQFLSETALLTLIAVLISLLLVNPILSLFQTLTPEGLTVNLFSWKTLTFLLFVTITTSLLSGFYPSWMLSSYVPALTLKGQTTSKGGEKGYLRKGLIVFQFTVSLVFIIGTLMVSRQLNFMRNKDLGFSTNAIISIRPGRDDKGLVLAQKIKQLAGVERVTMEWFPPMGEAFMVTKLKYRDSKNKKEVEMDVSAKVGDEHFIPLYQLRLVAGRNYLKSDSLRELVINETYAKALGFKKPADALNKLISFQDKAYPVVGVVADFHEQSFHEKIGPVFIANMPQARNIGIKLATRGKQVGDLKTTLASLEQTWQSVYPDRKFEYTFLDDSIAKLYEKEQKTGQLVNMATAIAILISCMGLFGLATFTAQQRTKEIGVRKVLGASVASIVTLLTKDFLKLVFVALILASPLAWWAMNRWLQDFAYKVDLDWWVFALAGILAIGIALVTVSFQSIKAALTNPVNSLRSE